MSKKHFIKQWQQQSNTNKNENDEGKTLVL